MIKQTAQEIWDDAERLLNKTNEQFFTFDREEFAKILQWKNMVESIIKSTQTIDSSITGEIKNSTFHEFFIANGWEKDPSYSHDYYDKYIKGEYEYHISSREFLSSWAIYAKCCISAMSSYEEKSVGEILLELLEIQNGNTSNEHK